MSDLSVVRLKKLGLKITPQRVAILGMLKDDRTHPSAEEVYTKISRKYPGISFATVYNTLSKLVEADEIQELDIDPEKKRFDPITAAHFHFYCQACARVYDVPCESALIPKMKRIDGHQIEAVQLNFKGLCKDCAEKKGNPTG